MVNASIPEGILEGLSGIAEGYFTKRPLAVAVFCLFVNLVIYPVELFFTGCSEVREVREVFAFGCVWLTASRRFQHSHNQTPHHISNDKVMPEETELYTGRQILRLVEPFWSTCFAVLHLMTVKSVPGFTTKDRN